MSLQVELAGQKFDAAPSGGKLHGLLESQNRTIPAVENDLHATARALVDRVNAIHENFFRPLTDPAQRSKAAFYVETLVASPSEIRTGASGAVGANDIALALADLRQTGVDELGTASIPGFYGELISAVGAKAAELNQQQETSELVLEQLKTRREGISGVSLDEEATDLIMYQRGFQAAARYIQVVDELIETLIQRL